MDEPIVLAHRVRGYSAGVWKTAGAATALVTSIGLMALTLDASKAVGIAAMLAAVMLFVGAFWVGQDGVTDLLAARQLRRLPRKTLTVGPDGVRFAARWPERTVELAATWDEIDLCERRPGLGGHVFLCFDAPGKYPTPPPGYGCAPGDDPDTIRRRALIWAVLRYPHGATAEELAMMVDTYVFGTPFAINPAICPGVDHARLHESLRRWSDGRCVPS
jgi:hypothetical protein